MDQGLPRAFDALARSRDILKGLQAQKPNDASYRVALAECDKELGIAEGEGGGPDRGLERLVEAESILKGLLSQSPGDPAYRKRLADTINAQGVIHFKNGNDEGPGIPRFPGEMPVAARRPREQVPRPVQLLDSLRDSYYNVGPSCTRGSHEGPGGVSEVAGSRSAREGPIGP